MSVPGIPRVSQPIPRKIRRTSNFRCNNSAPFCAASNFISIEWPGLQIHLDSALDKVYTAGDKVSGIVRLSPKLLRTEQRRSNVMERELKISLVGYVVCDRYMKGSGPDTPGHWEAADLIQLFRIYQRHGSPIGIDDTKLVFTFDFVFPGLTDPRPTRAWPAGLTPDPWPDSYPWNIERHQPLPPSQYLEVAVEAQARIVYFVEAWFCGTSYESRTPLHFCPPPLAVPVNMPMRTVNGTSQKSFRSFLKGLKRPTRIRKMRREGYFEAYITLPRQICLGDKIPVHIKVAFNKPFWTDMPLLEVKLLRLEVRQVSDLRFHDICEDRHSLITEAQGQQRMDRKSQGIFERGDFIAQSVEKQSSFRGRVIYNIELLSCLPLEGIAPDFATFNTACRSTLNFNVQIRIGALKSTATGRHALYVYPGPPEFLVRRLDKPSHESRFSRHKRLLIDLQRAARDTDFLDTRQMRGRSPDRRESPRANLTTAIDFANPSTTNTSPDVLRTRNRSPETDHIMPSIDETLANTAHGRRQSPTDSLTLQRTQSGHSHDRSPSTVRHSLESRRGRQGNESHHARPTDNLSIISESSERMASREAYHRRSHETSLRAKERLKSPARSPQLLPLNILTTTPR